MRMVEIYVKYSLFGSFDAFQIIDTKWKYETSVFIVVSIQQYTIAYDYLKQFQDVKES